MKVQNMLRFTMKVFIFFNMWVFCNSLLGLEEKWLIDHIKKSVRFASKNYSQLIDKPEILELQGMSSKKIRHLLNNICSFEECKYLEVGLWKGSTFISSLYKNPVQYVIGIDNFSEFCLDPILHKKNLISLLDKYIDGYQFFDFDCFKIDLNLFKKKINVFFYDGNHDKSSQEKALTYYEGLFDDLVCVIVDDYDWVDVVEGTTAGLAKINYDIIYEKTLNSFRDQNYEGWWNGLYVAVLKKRGT